MRGGASGFLCSAILSLPLGALSDQSRGFGFQVRWLKSFGETFPAGTLLVNISGSLVIGFFAGLTGPDGRFLVNPTIRQFFMMGICGGYTTFSSFSLQTLTLARDGEFLFAALNIASSVIFCLLAVWLGDYLAMHLNQR